MERLQRLGQLVNECSNVASTHVSWTLLRNEEQSRGTGFPTDGNVASVDISGAIAFLEAVFGKLELADRVAAATVAAAEARLGLRLPAALRTLYTATGAAKAIHHAHNEIVPPERIDFADDHLVFYEESQAAVVWGIARAHLDHDDPPVDQGQLGADGTTWAFFAEFRSTSEFACAQGSWQAVQGGLRYSGVREKAKGRTEKSAYASPGSGLAAKLGPAALVTEGMSAWLVDGGVAIELPDGYLALATREAPQFAAASARIGLAIEAWDYATLRDE